MKRVFLLFFAFNLLAVVNTMHMYGMCTGVCVGIYAIYIFICMYITHTGMRKILFIHVLVCWYLLLSPPLPALAPLVSCRCFFSVYATNHFTCHAFDSFAHTDIQSTIMPVAALVVVVVTVSFVVLMACH